MLPDAGNARAAATVGAAGGGVGGGRGTVVSSTHVVSSLMQLHVEKEFSLVELLLLLPPAVVERKRLAPGVGLGDLVQVLGLVQLLLPRLE